MKRSLELALLALALVACSSSSSDTPSPPADGGNATGDGGSAADASTPSAEDGGGTPGDVTKCGGPKPGPTNTGVPAGTALTPSGSVVADQDGQVIEGLDIEGEVKVTANNVTIRKCRITSGDYYPIRYDSPHTGLLVEDSEIIGTSGDVTSAVSFSDYTARRLNIHGSADGLKADSNVLIEGCWIHDLSNGDGEHNDAVQSTGGKGVTIRHSNLSGASNANVQTGDEGGVPTEDLTIDCSWLSGGGYTLNIRGDGATKPKNTRITNNRFGRESAYGPWTLDDPSPVVTGNVWDDDGSPIPYP